MIEPTGKSGALPEIRVPALWTFLGLAGGLAGGALVRGTGAEVPLLALAAPVGTLWLRALQMTIVPLVVALLFTGIVQTVAAARAGAMARRTLGLFATVLAAGTLLAALAMPLLLRWAPVPLAAASALGGARTAPAAQVPGLADFLGSLVPENVVAAAAGGTMVPLIVFVSLFALATTRLPEAPRRQLALLFEALAGAMMVVIGWVLALAPLGVFALATGVAAGSGAAAIGALAHYVALVSSIGFAVLAAAYPLARWLGGQASRHSRVRFCRCRRWRCPRNRRWPACPRCWPPAAGWASRRKAVNSCCRWRWRCFARPVRG